MIALNFIIILSGSNVWLASCVTCRKRSGTVQRIHRTGERIAIDDLILKYERQHRKLYEEEIRGGDYLEWPALHDKNLSVYCRKYLRQSIPSRNTDGATGIKIRKELQYEKENTSALNKVVIVQCKVMSNQYPFNYYMTRAPEPNCVFTLKSTRINNGLILTIINKCCDFEDTPLINKFLKQKKMEITSKKHHKTGQPIAKDEHILKYELEHQELVNLEGSIGKYLKWPLALVHPNLDYYCYQYMGECVSNRKRENVIGSRNIQKLQYQKLNTYKLIQVTTITCQPSNAPRLRYCITRAPESNCVYALLKRHGNGPLVIIFKHCNFEKPNNQQTIPQNYDDHDKDFIPKTEVKEEAFDTLETRLLIPED